MKNLPEFEVGESFFLDEEDLSLQSQYEWFTQDQILLLNMMCEIYVF